MTHVMATFDTDSIRVLLALVLVVVLSVGFSLATVTRNFHGRDKFLGWMAWIIGWVVLVFLAPKNFTFFCRPRRRWRLSDVLYQRNFR